MMSPKRVLIADDDEILLQMMMSYLNGQGYEVAGARDGCEALAALHTQEAFDVLVTDLNMPALNGLELMHEARKLKSPPEVIVVTAEATLETAITAMREEGASDYLSKPFKGIGELFLAVTRAAAYRQMRLEREMLVNRLAAEATRLRTLIANTGDAIFSADTAGVLRVVNPAAARLLGQNNLEGNDAQASLPSPLATLLANWQEVGGQRPMVVEVPWPVGALQTVNLTPIVASDGRPNGWVMVVRDITHLKRQDELKVRLLKETANKIQFPLARAIFTLAELKDVVEGHGEGATEIYYRLVKLWGRIQEWVDGLMNLVRIESGTGFHLVAVDLAAVLDEVRQGLTKGVRCDEKLKLTTDLPLVLPQVRADPNLLRQLLQGLIQRAVLQSEAGGEIHVTAREHQGHVWIEISDEGQPVTETNLPRPVEKPSLASSLDADNLGLELALAKSIIDQMNGQLWEGHPSLKGNTLTLCLLATSQAQAD